MKKNKNIVNNGLASALGLDNAQNPQTIYNNASPFLLTLNYQPLANTYKSNGFAQLAVDMPVSDAFRDGGFELTSATLSPDELEELNNVIQEKDVEILKQCLRWGRLYGGSVLICSCGQNTETPFNPETVYKKPVEFFAADRWQCYPQSTSLALANTFLLQDNTRKDSDNILIDKSRLMPFSGEVQPYYLRTQLQGWGCSIFEAIIPQLNEYLKANSVILELLDEAKIDILKIFGLSELLVSPNGESAVRRRAEIFAQQKNYRNMGVMDVQDDYVQKTMSFGGLNELLEKIFLLICASLRLPYSKVFGRGANGLGSGEELDLQNYYMLLESTLRVPSTPLIKWIAQIRACQLFGRKLDDLCVEWKPLKVLSETEIADLNAKKINACVQLLNAGVLTPKQIAEHLVKEGVIDLTDEEINAIDENIEVEEQQPVKKKDEKVKNSFFKSVVDNTQWVTVKPKGKDSEDYRHVPLDDDVDKNNKEEVKEGIKKFFQKLDFKKRGENLKKQDEIKDLTKKIAELKSNFDKLDRKSSLLRNKYIKSKQTFLFNAKNKLENEEMMNKLYQEYLNLQEERNKAVSEFNKVFKELKLKKKEYLENFINNFDVEKSLKKINTDDVVKKLEEVNKKYNYAELNSEYELIKKEYLAADLEKRKQGEVYKWGTPEREKFVDEIIEWQKNSDIGKKYNKIREKLNNFDIEKCKAISKALQFNNGGVFALTTSKNGVLTENVKETNELLTGIINKKYIPDFSPEAKGRKGRACQKGNLVFFDSIDDPASAIHECMHWLEEVNPEMLAKSKAFLRYRTKQDLSKSLSELTGNKNYKKDEIAKADNFFSPYCGKEYDTATEIMSMGVQYLFENPEKFIKEDREYFNFVIGNLRGEL